MRPTKEEFTAAVHCLAGYAAPHEKALLADYDSTLGIRDASTEILKKTYAALEAAEADSARLDWVEKAHKAQGINFAKYHSSNSTYIEHLSFVGEGEDIARGGNVREAIDAARKEDRT